MSAGLIGLQQQMTNDAMQGFRQVTAEQEKDKATNKQLEAAAKQQTMNAVASGAAIGGYAAGPIGAAVGAGIGLIASAIL